jgi:hypothetical protein
MTIERLVGPRCLAPFPVYQDLPDVLVAAHSDTDGRDATVAHVLATGASYCYSDLATVAVIASRLGMDECNCVRVAQAVDAMYIFSTACLVQSRCGRVVILCYRGTEPTNLGSWMGDFDVECEELRSESLDPCALKVHGGFHRNFRATRWDVEQQLGIAANGRSLADPDRRVEHKLEALYVAGHSLGGAMAVLFALTSRRPELRAVYTYGQPMVVHTPVAPNVEAVGGKVYRHVLARDPVPALPPASFGAFAHLGSEFVFDATQWTRAERPTKALKNVPRALLSTMTSGLTPGKGLSFEQHGPHRYLDALRPANRPTEFGD